MAVDSDMRISAGLLHNSSQLLDSSTRSAQFPHIQGVELSKHVGAYAMALGSLNQSFSDATSAMVSGRSDDDK